MSDTKKLSIFNSFGGISRNVLRDSEGQEHKVFILLSSVSNRSSNTGYLLGSAPVSGVQITQLTDFNVTKALDGDFLVASFGNTPVKIQLSGISFLSGMSCKASSNGTSNEQILKFYKENRISTDASNRIDVSITQGDDAVAFRCVLVGMEVQNKASENNMGNIFCTYTMSLIGVDRVAANTQKVKSNKK